jgi:ribonuclease P protein component
VFSGIPLLTFMTDCLLTKKERILKHSDFKTIYQRGEKTYTEHFLVFTCPNALGWKRLGVTVSKAVGNAIARNYVKRLLREYFRLHKKSLPASADILIIAKPGSPELKYYALCAELDSLFKS